MSSTRVAIVGATGETGSSIVNGLLDATKFSLVALTRPTSVEKPATTALKNRGVEIVSADLTGPEDDLIKALQGIDILISAIGPTEQQAQIPLATAAKKAGVKRFIPCGFITIAPPNHVMTIRDDKEQVYNHVKKIRLAYTIIDVGWWYQISVPRLPSGKIDYCVPEHVANTLVNDGNMPSALTDVSDIGRYVARIIDDERTLNKYVFAYNEVWKPNDVYSKLEEISGEKIPRGFVSEQELREKLAETDRAVEEKPDDRMAMVTKWVLEYQLSWGARGDNTPEYAKYLGYLTSKDLYPDLEFKSFESFLHELLSGKAKGVYQGK